jgi:hypothetical protein
VRAEVADAVGADRTAADQVLERAERLLERDLRIELVSEIEVDVTGAQAVEARCQLALDPFGRQPVVRAGRSSGCRSWS